MRGYCLRCKKMVWMTGEITYRRNSNGTFSARGKDEHGHVVVAIIKNPPKNLSKF